MHNYSVWHLVHSSNWYYQAPNKITRPSH